MTLPDEGEEENDEKSHHVLLLPVRESLAFEAGLDEVGAGAMIAELFASGLDTEGLADGAVAESAGDAIVEEVEVAVLEFYDLSTIDTDEMVVCWAVDEVWIIISLAVTEVDLVDEVRFGKQGECPVNGSTGGLSAGGAEAIEELIRCEVFICGKDHVYDFIPLSGLS